MRNIYVSSGAFIGRVNNRDPAGFLRIAPGLACDGFEFMFYGNWYDDIGAIVDRFRRLERPFPVLHVEKSVGELLSDGSASGRREALRRFRVNCRAAEALGARILVWHLWNGLPSDRHLAYHFDAYPSFREEAERHGLLLTVENVVAAVGSPLAHLLALQDRYSDAAFTFDTKMAQFHRELRQSCTGVGRRLWENGNICHVHANDYRGGYKDFSNLKVLHPTEGDVDYPWFFSFLDSVGYTGDVTLECTCMRPDGTLTPERMQNSLAYVRALNHS